ncbi:MAG: monofunctional biosynthetic peptidoglycan transglycosylase [Pseudomonadota bacterium]
MAKRSASAAPRVGKAASARGGGARRAARRTGPIGWLLGRLRRLVAMVFRVALLAAVVLLLAIGAMRWIDPPGGPYMWGEAWRLGGVAYRPISLDAIGLDAARAAVAAEDARFCTHAGIDWTAVHSAIEDYRQTGRLRGASTITQQTAKNVFLWHGRTMVRKALEVPFAGVIELIWGKRRILEVYLNVAEFDEGVFGIDAAARHYYGVPAQALLPLQTARLMTLLPSPKTRHPRALDSRLERRARQIAAGAQTVVSQDLDSCIR